MNLKMILIVKLAKKNNCIVTLLNEIFHLNFIIKSRNEYHFKTIFKINIKYNHLLGLIDQIKPV